MEWKSIEKDGLPSNKDVYFKFYIVTLLGNLDFWEAIFKDGGFWTYKTEAGRLTNSIPLHVTHYFEFEWPKE